MLTVFSKFISFSITWWKKGKEPGQATCNLGLTRPVNMCFLAAMPIEWYLFSVSN